MALELVKQNPAKPISRMSRYEPYKQETRRRNPLDRFRTDAKDEDIEAVRKAFAVIAHVVAAAKGRLQVIVLDYAPRYVWGSIKNIVAVEEWREGKKLVPSEWIA